MSRFSFQGLFGQKERRVNCEKCGNPVLVPGKAARPFFCDKCQVFDRAQNEIYLQMGQQVTLAPIPTLRGNVHATNPRQPWDQMREGEPGSECMYCGERLWQLSMRTAKGCFAKVDDEPLLLPHGPGTDLIYIECANPDCHGGWNSVRSGQRDMTGLPPDLTPPWAQGDEEHHERWWAAFKARSRTNAGKGVILTGMFGTAGTD